MKELNQLNLYGSSPLTRRNLFQFVFLYFLQRFIPAYAGNPSESTPTFQFNTVHPRLRGEIRVSPIYRSPEPGSSPLTRGNRIDSCFISPLLRFIPAYAGKSFPETKFITLGAVHPRLRGEIKTRPSFLFCSDGSSPLTRGNPLSSKDLGYS